jgi:hypothetical protein
MVRLHSKLSRAANDMESLNVANATLYYSLLGEKINAVQNSNAHLLHKEEGMNSTHYKSLPHKYCTNNQDSVIYIHSIRIIPPKIENTLLRRLLTAVFGCSLRISRRMTTLATFVRSFLALPLACIYNMWIARCDYVLT